MTRRAVCVVQHVACEPPSLIAEVLRSKDCRLQWARPYRGDRVPSRLGGCAGLVVMGGPMGANDNLPFLRQERRLIEDALTRKLPVLGICLGSQLLASVLGAPVYPGPRKEIGWHEVTLSRLASRDALWGGVASKFTPLHWHGDVFDLPRGAVSLARSKWTRHQAFRHGANAYGILFHLEVTEAQVRRMVRQFAGELEEAGVCGKSLLAEMPGHLDTAQAWGRQVFSRWADLLPAVG